MPSDLSRYLEASDIIDHEHPAIQAKSAELAAASNRLHTLIKTTFEFVRDEIRHSSDFQLNPVTLKASEVLLEGTGFCYAKSHLLAALLRANKIPTGLCYQRLTIDNDKPPFCLHGLNAVHIEGTGWYRMDARGNKPGVNAAFTPPVEQLAFPIAVKGEKDLPGIFDYPLPSVVNTLSTSNTWLSVLENLPDWQS